MSTTKPFWTEESPPDPLLLQKARAMCAIGLYGNFTDLVKLESKKLARAIYQMEMILCFLGPKLQLAYRDAFPRS